MKIKFKKIISILLTAAIILSIGILTTTTTYAATGSKTVKSISSMDVALKKGETGFSSYVTFKVSGLPAEAKVTKIEVNVGSLSFQGGVMTNYLELTSSNNAEPEIISWGGEQNVTLTSKTFFSNTIANGTYLIRFNATCISGAIVGGKVLDIGSKTYSSPSIKIYYTY